MEGRDLIVHGFLGYPHADEAKSWAGKIVGLVELVLPCWRLTAPHALTTLPFCAGPGRCGGGGGGMQAGVGGDKFQPIGTTPFVFRGQFEAFERPPRGLLGAPSLPPTLSP